MATGRKYAGLLPDLDEDRDLFETPELTDDASTRPPESDIADDDDDDDDDDATSEDDISGISRHRFDTDTARSHFHSSKVDARRTNFSDRLDSKRKSYRVTSRQRDDDVSDGEDASPKDGLKRKIATLLREAEELKAEAQRQAETAAQADDRPDDASLRQLSSAIGILETLGPSAGGLGAEARLAKQLSEAVRPGATATIGDAPPSSGAPTYTLAYQPSFDDNHALALAASFDTRLQELETQLGLASVSLPTQTQDGAAPPKPLLPTLDGLEAQIKLLATTTPAQLDSMSKRIRTLTDEAERLAERRKAAKQSYADMRDSTGPPGSSGSGTGGDRGGDGAASSATLLEDAETESKITALYDALPTIEALAPTLPAVLDRLKSLRLLHADAADAAQRMARVETVGGEMREEMARWRLGLERLEKAVESSEEGTRRNMQTVEGWVKELEGRTRGLKVEK